MERRGLSLVGWYHSHSEAAAQPSIRDIESQFEYQLCLKGFSNAYHPCIGMIIGKVPSMYMYDIRREPVRSRWLVFASGGGLELRQKY